MEVDHSKLYNMPLLLGPLFDHNAPPRIEYKQVEVLSFQYLTDPEALTDLLPEHYHPGKEPLVTVTFSQNNGLPSLAGAGYRFAMVQVEARFDGKQNHVIGDYILVKFANQTWPIIAGREDFGVPCLFADISPIKVLPDGHLRCEASCWGHMLFGLDVPPLKGQMAVMRAVISRQVNARPWLGHKYIPSFEGPPDADYPTLLKMDASLNKLWLGKRANLRFGTARFEDILNIKYMIDALATLTIIKPVQVIHFFGSILDRYDLYQRLI